MIADSARYYGAVFSFIFDCSTEPVAIRKADENFAGFYLLNEDLPVYIKYSTRRKGPWSFTFQREHQEKQRQLENLHGECIVVLVCGRDGIVALKNDEFRAVLDHVFEEQESVIVRRRHNEMYQIRGRDGELAQRISRNRFVAVLQSMNARWGSTR